MGTRVIATGSNVTAWDDLRPLPEYGCGPAQVTVDSALSSMSVAKAVTALIACFPPSKDRMMSRSFRNRQGGECQVVLSVRRDRAATRGATPSNYV
jgi:hypothetical protein